MQIKKIGTNVELLSPETDPYGWSKELEIYTRFLAKLDPPNQQVTVFFPVQLEHGVNAETHYEGNAIYFSTLPFLILTRFLEPTFNVPVSTQVPYPLYVMSHEWGHIRQPLLEMPQLESAITHRQLSTYGQSNPNDAFAESYAEWHLSLGKTENIAAKSCAKEYGWRTDFTSIKLPVS